MMKLVLLAALAAASQAQAPQIIPLEKVAWNAAFCLGWVNVERAVEQGLTTQIDQKELNMKLLRRTYPNLLVGDITIPRRGGCGRTLPTTDQKVSDPTDFRRPHASAFWTTPTAKHAQILIYMEQDGYGGSRFLLVSGDTSQP